MTTDSELPRPEAKRGVAAKLSQTMERAQERVLADVIGVVGSDDTAGDPEDNVAVALYEPLEGVHVTVQRSLDQLLVGIGNGGSARALSFELFYARHIGDGFRGRIAPDQQRFP